MRQMAATADEVLPGMFDLGTGLNNRPVTPLLKWPGGKSGELRQILAAMPSQYDRYAEPFAGGAAVFFALPASSGSVLNDVSVELMTFYRLVQAEDAALQDHLWAIHLWWQAWGTWVEEEASALVASWEHRHEDARFTAHVDEAVKDSLAGALALIPASFADLKGEAAKLVTGTVPKKLVRMRKVERDRGEDLPHEDVRHNVEGAYKAVIYTVLRAEYNRGRLRGRQDALQAALFFFLREYAYAAMFRFNGKGEFNVPYGGISYNQKDFFGKLKHMQSDDVLSRLREAHLSSTDFERCLTDFAPSDTDFVFLDPPYDSDFSAYDLNAFGRADHQRLGAVLRALTSRFMLVIKATPFIERLYPVDHFNVTAFDKTYMWTIKERNDREATHLLITNYEPTAATT